MKRLLVVLLCIVMMMPCNIAHAKMEDVDDTVIYIDIPEEGNSFDTATKLEIDGILTIYTSVLGTETENDYFKFKAPCTGKYQFFTTGINTTSTTAKLYTSSEDEVNINILDSGEGNFTFTKTLKEGKWYYLKIYSPDNIQGDYNLNIVILSDEYEASNTINNAVKITTNEWCTSIDYSGDYDFYSFEVKSSGMYTFSSEYYDEGMDPEIVLWKGKEVIAWDWDSGEDKNFYLATFLRKGIYIIEIYSSNNCGTIDFTIEKQEKE